MNTLEQIIVYLGEFLYKILPFDCLADGFMQRALIGLLLITPLAAVTGVQVVNSRMAFFSDAIGHSAFAGLAIGLIFAINPDWTMPALAVIVGILIMALRRGSRLSSDTAIGVIFSAVVAFGLAIVKRNPSVARNIEMFLYGDIITISEKEILILFILFLLFIVFQFFSYNRLLSISVNPRLASVHRIPVALYQYAFTIFLSLVVIFSVRVVGVILVTALLIVPAATARNLAKSSRAMFWISFLIGYLSAVSGFLISAQEWARTATGATIVLVSSFLFCLSMLFVFLKPGKSADTEK